MTDQRLDAAQALGQAEQPRPGEEAPGVLAASPQPDADHAAEVAHLAGGDLVVGMVAAGPDSRPARPSGCSASQSASACALAQCRSMRTASVLMPRRTSQASNGPGTPPAAFW